MPFMYSEMQNKLSKTRESPLDSMGQIISSRCPIGRGTKSCVFYSNRIRTLVAMATYSSHRLIMGKEEIDKKNSVSLGIFGFFLQKCLLSSPLRFLRLLSKSFNLIGCRGGKKGQFS